MRIFLAVCCGLGLLTYLGWDVIRQITDEVKQQRKDSALAASTQQQSSAMVSAANDDLRPNEKFLHAIRERSGYGTLRALHDALVYVAIAAIVGGSLYLCSIAPTVLAGAIVVGAAALFVVALLIERRVFVLIVDAVDVYVDRTRREAEGK